MSTPDRIALLDAYATPCPDCHQPIMWAWTRASDLSERMPLDAVPVANGNVRAYREGRRLVCDVIGSQSERRKLTLGGWPLYQHHRLTCPKAHKWARQTPKSRPEPRRTLEAPDGGGLW